MITIDIFRGIKQQFTDGYSLSATQSKDIAGKPGVKRAIFEKAGLFYLGTLSDVFDRDSDIREIWDIDTSKTFISYGKAADALGGTLI